MMFGEDVSSNWFAMFEEVQSFFWIMLALGIGVLHIGGGLPSNMSLILFGLTTTFAKS